MRAAPYAETLGFHDDSLIMVDLGDMAVPENSFQYCRVDEMQGTGWSASVVHCVSASLGEGR